MRVSVPANIATALAAVFSLYHLVLATTSLSQVHQVVPVIACMLLYAGATAVALLTPGHVLRVWAACAALATAFAIPLVIAPQLPKHIGTNSYVTWYIAAIGTLMVILAVRQRTAFAWVGVAFLAAHTVLWAGPGALGTLGVIGSVAWVAIATAFAYAVNRATRITRDFVAAEQETADWQAAQDAHVFERQFRLEQTTRMALPMLQQIIVERGALSDDERAECLRLEQAIRDEIRGRSLLSDDVRRQVRVLRRAGATVQLHDDGGLEDVEPDDLARIHSRLAAALQEAEGSDTVIVRTVQGGAEAAVTVVGLRLDTEASESAALGIEDDDDDDAGESVVVWLEIPRREQPAVQA
ncbi:hypothetical protein [Curtobacterium ammoniigenes]|uniref:hypothetical protein n=1 Tax=Curtobacterium ammoniigenes TaxID=395387 RepID=UPI00082C7B21|nr:hypothetical protein [Curtobacterium ammoniigenes]